jgi:hypothetical protein
MSNPKEKAIELVDKFKYNTRAWNETNGWKDCFYNAKQCALIAVDEITDIAYWEYMESGSKEEKIYWQEVKQAIQEL